MKRKIKSKIIFEEPTWNHKTMGYFFFGIGVTMFILNLITVINAINLVISYGENIKFPLNGYYTSLVSSVILMTYSLYNIYGKD